MNIELSTRTFITLKRAREAAHRLTVSLQWLQSDDPARVVSAINATQHDPYIELIEAAAVLRAMIAIEPACVAEVMALHAAPKE